MAKNTEERYPVEVHWSNEDHAFLAEVYDLPGCLADGKTEAEAAAVRDRTDQDGGKCISKEVNDE